MKYRNTYLPLLTVLIVLTFIINCSSLRDSDQFTNKIEAPLFVSELYGSSTQTLSINHPDGGHVSWMGFIQSNNYKYFKVTKVQVGSETIVSDGVEKEGELFTASSNSIIQDIDIGSSESGNNEYVDGSINVAGNTDLKITINYAPLQAIEDENTPHEAFLVINYDLPIPGSVLIWLKAETDGTKSEKCTQDPSTMEVIEYRVVDSAFDLYFCSAEVAANNQNNTPQESSDPDYHGASTNIASIAMEDDVITFYKVDDETVCVLTEPDPSIPSFVLPIPDGLAPIESMDINIMEGSYAECALDPEGGNIFCDANIQIDALVSLTGMTLTNQSYTADELVTNDCPDFGAISGSGVFGDDELTLIFVGKTISDMNTEEYGIVDSLIVAEIALEK